MNDLGVKAILLDIITNGHHSHGHIVDPDKIADGLVAIVKLWYVKKEGFHGRLP